MSESVRLQSDTLAGRQVVMRVCYELGISYTPLDYHTVYAHVASDAQVKEVESRLAARNLTNVIHIDRGQAKA